MTFTILKQTFIKFHFNNINILLKVGPFVAYMHNTLFLVNSVYIYTYIFFIMHNTCILYKIKYTAYAITRYIIVSLEYKS